MVITTYSVMGVAKEGNEEILWCYEEHLGKETPILPTSLRPVGL